MLKKFYQYLSPDAKERIVTMKERIVFWNPNRVQSANYLEIILNAAVDQSALSIHYDSRNGVSERYIQPIGLYSHNGFWYCPAYCFLRKDIRLFRADRIKKVARTEAEVQNLSNPSVMDWIEFSEEEVTNPITFTVELTKDGVRRAMSELDLERIVKERENGTGWIEAEIPKSELKFFVDLIWNFGNEAFILEPAEAITYMKQKLKMLSEQYS